MTTNEFIKMLQEADPEGTSHIRIDGYPPVSAYKIDGYWDGPYTYIDEDGKYVLSKKNEKVDIHTMSKEEMIDDVIHSFNPWTDTIEGLWEKAKEKFRFEEIDEKRIESFFIPLKEFFDKSIQRRKNFWPKELEKVIDLHQRGCRFFRKKDVGNMIYYTGWEWVNEKNPQDIGSANLAHTYPILKSGKFEVIETDFFPNNEYFEYVLKK